MKLDKIDGKGTFKLVLWGFGIFLVFYFFKEVKGFLDILFGKKKTEDQLLVESQQKADISSFEKRYGQNLYKFLPIDKARAVANQLEQLMNQSRTDWKLVSELIAKNQINLGAIYVQFGSRLNSEFSNMQGDLLDWLVREKGNTYIYGPATPAYWHVINNSFQPWHSKDSVFLKSKALVN